jgi:predicted amidophosphoribosyltransferase
MNSMPRPRWARSAAGSYMDLLWPPRCPVCDLESGDGEIWDSDGSAGRELLHRECLLRVPTREIRTSIGNRGAISVDWLYEDCPEFFRILHAVKYEGQWPLLGPLVSCFAEWASRSLQGPGEFLLVPVPDDPMRRRRRGDSVVDRLARGLAVAGGGALEPSLLCRRRAGVPQARIVSAARRAQNVRNLFGVGDLARAAPRHRLVLIDDQITTGATARAAARILGLRGNQVRVLALAGARHAPNWLDP